MNRYLCLGAVLVLVFGIGHARAADTPASVDAKRMIGADRDAANWLSYGRTYSEQRFSPLSKINADNAKQLGLAWYADLDTNRGQEATPLVIDGVLYTSTAWSLVKAYDAATGKLLWSYDPEVPKELGVEGCCDVVSRGIAAWNGRIYLATFDARLVAIDARTGKPAWRFYTVPGDPSKPFENKAMEMAAKTWSGEWWKEGGGGVVWDAISYDPELNLVYFGVGNGLEWARKYRSANKGDNLFLSSIVALNADTGAYVWHFQVNPGEEWDYDAVGQLTLADLKIDGKPRKVIMQANKNGFFYVLDRKTGKFIHAKQYVPQNWADGLDPKSGRPIEHANIRYSSTGQPVVMMPGPDGAHSWHPMAYNPKTGLVYIPAQEIGKSFTPVKDFKTSEMGWNLGVDVAGTPGDKKGYLLAWDPVAQKEVWRSEHVGPWNGGIVTTAGNLVIQGDATGHLNAYRADTGEQLWSIDVQSPIMAAPVSYEVNGEQYIAVLSGFGSAFSLQAGKVAAQSGNIRNISRVLAYKVGGTATLPAAPPVQQLVLNPPPATADAATVSAGDQLFGRYCAACHGENAVGGGVVPDLRASNFLGNDFFYEIVLNGAMKDAGMAPFKAVLDQKDAAAIRAYLIKRANEDKVSGVK